MYPGASLRTLLSLSNCLIVNSNSSGKPDDFAPTQTTDYYRGQHYIKFKQMPSYYPNMGWVGPMVLW